MEKKYERVRYKIVRTKPEIAKRMNKEAMLKHLKKEPWLAEILRKNFTEDEVEWFRQPDSVSGFLETNRIMNRERVHRSSQKS